MMKDRIEYEADQPDVMEIDNHGRVEYFEFEKTIWIKNIFADRRGTGIRLMRKMISYAREVGKSIYGDINPKDEMCMMDRNRIIRLYKHFGGEMVGMQGHPHAMKLEI